MTATQADRRGLSLVDGHYTIPRTRRGASREILRGASLRVAVGEQVGLVGPNGSGKSTLLKILAGMLRLQSGRLMNDDVSAGDPTRRYQRSVHLVAGAPLGFYPRLTGVENLRFVGGLYGRDVGNHGARTSLEHVGLDRVAADMMYSKYSLGMRQRLHLAAARLDSPATIWLLDEPTIGLDNAGVDVLRRVLDEADGIAQCIVSHDEQFLSERCSRVIELRDGHLVD